jgi:hypothetical protein
MYADRQNTFDAAWQGQPQGMPLTLRALSDGPAGNIVNVPPQDAAEQVTPPPVVHSGTVSLEGRITTGASGQSAPSALNKAGQPVTFVNDNGEPVTFVNDKGERVTWTADERSRAEAPLSGGGNTVNITYVTRNNLSKRPTDIRDAARVLVKEIKDQVEQLQKSKPNDKEGLAKHNEFVAFLERITAGLTELADALDQAVSASPNGPPEPIFLGKAARIAEQLNVGMMEWLEANRANVAGCTLRIGLIGAGYLFLNTCGLDGNIAAIVGGLVNRGFTSNKKTSTTRAKKRSAKG